jgi:hypothetical protein
MRSDIYRFRLARHVRPSAVNDTIVTAIAATGALYGEARSRLEISYAHGRSRRVFIVDATLPAGRAFARVFAGLLIARFGANAIRVERARRRRRLSVKASR